MESMTIKIRCECAVCWYPEKQKCLDANVNAHDEDEAEVQRGGGGAREEKQKATGTAAAGDPNHSKTQEPYKILEDFMIT